MTWLDIGNSYRNIYLLSIFFQAIALGLLFAKNKWFSKKSPISCFLTGVSITPFVQYLFMLILAFLWPNAPKEFIVLTLPIIAISYCSFLFFTNIKNAKQLIKSGYKWIKSTFKLNKTTIICLCFALCMFILIFPSMLRFLSSMSTVTGGDSGEYLGLSLKYAEDRNISPMLDKNYEPGTLRQHSHFPSYELYNSYALLHTGEVLGYPFDKPAFTGIGLLAFYMFFAYLALLFHFCNNNIAYISLGILLFNLVPNLFHSIQGAPRDIWRILAVLVSVLFFSGITEKGNKRKYIAKCLLVFILCFTVMSTHVVCFVILPFVVLAWGVYRVLIALFTKETSLAYTFFRCLGLGLIGALGTLLAFSGNIYCYIKWGQMSPWRLMTTFTSAPWYNMYMQLDYKLEETTTNLNFFEAFSDILMSYSTKIGIWGFWLALFLLLFFVVILILKYVCKKNNNTITNYIDNNFLSYAYLSLIVIFTLAPMTGVLDNPVYSFSGSFLKMQRYTLQWFMLCGIIIPSTLYFIQMLLNYNKVVLSNLITKKLKVVTPIIFNIPIYLCAFLCIVSFVNGTKQTGYSTSYYRFSRDIMENPYYLLDESYIKQYGLLTHLQDNLKDEEKILISRVGYQYALRNEGLVLLSNPISPLLNLKLSEIEQGLKDKNIVMLATQGDFWDKRYFPLSTLGIFAENLPKEQIIDTENMRIYLFDDTLVSIANEYLKLQE